MFDDRNLPMLCRDQHVQLEFVARAMNLQQKWETRCRETSKAGLRVGKITPDQDADQLACDPVSGPAFPWNVAAKLTAAENDRVRVQFETCRDCNDVFRYMLSVRICGNDAHVPGKLGKHIPDACLQRRAFPE